MLPPLHLFYSHAKVHFIHFIYHSPSRTHLSYFVTPMLHCYVGVCKITCLVCWRALRAGVLTSTLIGLLGCFRAACLCSCMLDVLNVPACLRAKVLACLACSHVYVFTCLACLFVLCPYVLTCIMCLLCSNILRACMLLWHRLPYFLFFTFKNFF